MRFWFIIRLAARAPRLRAPVNSALGLTFARSNEACPTCREFALLNVFAGPALIRADCSTEQGDRYRRSDLLLGVPSGSPKLEASMLVTARVLCPAVLVLSACGAEVAGTAATVGKLQATQAQEAQSQQEQIKKKMDAALQGAQAAASAALKD